MMVRSGCWYSRRRLESPVAAGATLAACLNTVPASQAAAFTAAYGNGSTTNIIPQAISGQLAQVQGLVKASLASEAVSAAERVSPAEAASHVSTAEAATHMATAEAASHMPASATAAAAVPASASATAGETVGRDEGESGDRCRNHHHLA